MEDEIKNLIWELQQKLKNYERLKYEALSNGKLVDQNFYHGRIVTTESIIKRLTSLITKPKEGSKFYAKIKGYNLLGYDPLEENEKTFFNYDKQFKRLTMDTKEQTITISTKMTKEQWNALGITEENADFVEVEEDE